MPDPRHTEILNKHCKKRLNQLIRALRSKKLHVENFNLDLWAEQPPDKPTLECGTAACAIGLATAIPAWANEEFHLQPDSVDSGFLVPTFHNLTEDVAISDYLDISVDEAQYLFFPSWYKNLTSNLAVARRIEKFMGVRDHGW